jgi:hypothetical protein
MRKLRHSVLLILGFVLTLQAASAPQQNNRPKHGVDGTILLGCDYAFILKEPNGWVLDTSVGNKQGMDAVLYPEGSSWKESTAVMYVRIIYKNATDKKTIDQVIQDDIDTFKAASSDSTVTSMPSFTTRDKKSAIAKNFYDAHNKNYEAVGFIDEPKVVVIAVLSSRSKEDYDKSLSSFKDLIASYFFVKELVDAK